MATVTKTVTENELSSYKSTWTITATITDVTATASTFIVKNPTITAKYVYSGKNYGAFSTEAHVDKAIYPHHDDEGYPYYTYEGSWASNATKTISQSPYSTDKQGTVTTSQIFNENNNTTAIAYLPLYMNIYAGSWYGTSMAMDKENSYSSPASGDTFNNAVKITLNVPPTATVGLLNRTTASGYYAGITSVYVPITDLTAYYGGNFTDGQGGVTLEIGNQTNTIHADGALVISPLNTVGTFTPKVTVTDSRGQTYVETLDPITVTEYKPTANILDLQRINATGEPEDDPDPEKPSDEGTNAVIACQFDYPTISNNYMQAPIVKIDGASPTNTVNWYTSWTESGGFSGQVSFSSYNPTRPVTLYGKISDTLATDMSYEISVACDTTLGSGDADAQTLSQAFYLLSAAAGGHGLGVGMKVPPSANGRGLHVGMDATFYENLYATQIPGIIKMFAGTFAPTGWLLCNGAEVAVADYPFLYDVIGDTYGTPSDSDHFVLPDFRGRTPIGTSVSHQLASTGGSEYIQSHTHAFTQPSVTATQSGVSITGGSHSHRVGYNSISRGTGSSSFRQVMGTSATSHVSSEDATHTHTLPAHTHTLSNGAVGAVSGATTGSSGNMPPFLTVNYIISTGGISRWADSAGLPIVRDVAVNGQSIVQNEIANFAVTTPSVSMSAATGSVVSLYARQWGAMVWISFSTKNDTGAINAGANIFAGNITGIPYPARFIVCGGYYGNHAISSSLGADGSVVVRNASSTAVTINGSNTTTSSFCYIAS